MANMGQAPASPSASVDPFLTDRICATTSLQELDNLRVPFDRDVPLRHDTLNSARMGPGLGTWMIWMVHRVFLGDPDVVKLDFSMCRMPNARDAHLVITKLLHALHTNTHLEELQLADCQLIGGEQANAIAAMLIQSRTLRVLNLNSNMFEPADLQMIFEALAQNDTLEELRCANQFCGSRVGREAFQALGQALKENRSLRKLGLDLTDAHWRNQVDRALTRNIDLARKARWEAAGMQLEEY